MGWGIITPQPTRGTMVKPATIQAFTAGAKKRTTPVSPSIINRTGSTSDRFLRACCQAGSGWAITLPEWSTIAACPRSPKVICRCTVFTYRGLNSATAILPPSRACTRKMAGSPRGLAMASLNTTLPGVRAARRPRGSRAPSTCALKVVPSMRPVPEKAPRMRPCPSTMHTC